MTNGEHKQLFGLIVTIKKKSQITTKLFQNHLSLSSQIVEEQEKHNEKLLKMFDEQYFQGSFLLTCL